MLIPKGWLLFSFCAPVKLLDSHKQVLIFLVVFWRQREDQGRGRGRRGIIPSTIFFCAYRNHFFSCWQMYMPSSVESLPFSIQLKPILSHSKMSLASNNLPHCFSWPALLIQGLDPKCKQGIERLHFLRFQEDMLCYFCVWRCIWTSVCHINVKEKHV